MERQNTAILIDKEYLHKLKEDSNSCVEAQKAVKHLSLHPFQLIDESAAIKDVLNKGVGKYDKKLKGILLGHESITLLDPIAAVPADSCFPHFDIEAVFFVFKPILEKVLVGVVNKKSKDHVGCLVHKVFNVSLPKPPDEKRWIGDDAEIGQEVEFKISFTDFNGKLPYIRGEIFLLGTYINVNLNVGDDAEIGQEVEFKISFTDFNGKLPYIRGEILSVSNEDSGISAGEDLAESKPNTVIKFDDSDNEEETVSKKRKRKSTECDGSFETPKKQRKHKKKDRDVQDPEEFTVETPPRKKKLKDTSPKIDFSDPETTIHDSQSEEYPRKKTKKHKKKVKDEST